ncbi:hypothetical protein [Porphyromonas loveana]|uniref:hypothetical protein n=1 Tax=Porphyromonas loveana TaxID=1884669 RepID=UPI00359FCB62
MAHILSGNGAILKFFWRQIKNNLVPFFAELGASFRCFLAPLLYSIAYLGVANNKEIHDMVIKQSFIGMSDSN